MKVVLTGASRGLGLQIAKQLAGEGHTVFALCRSMSDELQELQNKTNALVQFVECDLLNTDFIQQLTIRKIFLDNAIDALVSNAALAYDDLISNLNQESLEKMFQVNTLAPMVLTKSAIRNMLLHNTSGSIVHISSISAHTGYKGLAMYAASKGAIEAFSKNTAREWGGRGIRSNCVVAGFMETEMSAELSDEQKQRIYQRTSLKKSTETASVASMVQFLLSTSACGVTGQNLFVDSGTI